MNNASEFIIVISILIGAYIVLNKIGGKRHLLSGEKIYLDTRTRLFTTKSTFIESMSYREIQEFFGDPEKAFQQLIADGVIIEYEVSSEDDTLCKLKPTNN